MKERPIIFSAPMVRAILDGRKTQTRRVMKPQPDAMTWDTITIPAGGGETTRSSAGHAGYSWLTPIECRIDPRGEAMLSFCPYGAPGDRLWVRETFIAARGVGGYVEGADPDSDPNAPTVDVIYRADDGPNERSAGPWTPAIHMPRRASRMTLEVVSVRAEPVQEISHHDALEEGIAYDVSKEDGSPLARFRATWDALNSKRGYPWASNPWVWAITFRVLKPSRQDGVARTEAGEGQT